MQAIVNLAVMCAEGRGGPRDEAKARQLFTKAGAGGDMQATRNLAVMYQTMHDLRTLDDRN